jgi:hypothetical protein
MVHKILLDLCLTLILTKHFTDEFAPLSTSLGRADVQGSALADRTIQLLGDAINFIVRGRRTLSKASSRVCKYKGESGKDC